MTPKELHTLGAPALVYVREVRAADILAQEPDLVFEDPDIQPDQSLYAVHSANGERLAIVLDRETAFAAALAYEMEPVSVH
jgi:Uncharacterized small protein